MSRLSACLPDGRRFRSVTDISKGTPVTDKPSSGVSVVQAAILDLMFDRGLTKGDSLPTETELAKDFGISRNSVREAIKALQALRVVTIRHGSGTFVAEGNFDALVELLSFRARMSIKFNRDDAVELVEVREALEIGLLPRAMALMEAADLEAIDRIVIAMESRAVEGDHFADIDGQFHMALYRPLGNRLLMDLIRSFWVAYQPIAMALDDDSVNPLEDAASHRRIFETIQMNDPTAATDAMRLHFHDIRNRIGMPIQQLAEGR